jgi:Protein of unknown function (DUF2829)
VNFGEALAAMREGKRVTREMWEDGREEWQGAYVMYVELEPPCHPQIMFGYAGREGLWSFSGAQVDLLAEDWKVLS